MDPAVRVRPALPADAPRLAEIYGHHVRHGFGTFEEDPPPAEEMARRLAAVVEAGLPYLAAEAADGALMGFAYAGPFRLRAAYRYTVEDSVYVAPEAVGQGVGRAVLGAVLDHCAALGLRHVIAVIGDSGNAASIALHTSLGFQPAGVGQGLGWKHGRWVDIVWMRKPLNGGDLSAPDAPGLVFGR